MAPHNELITPMIPLPYRLRHICEELPGCMTLTVEPEGEVSCHHWQPGQFFMIYVFGHGEVPISISGDPEESAILTFTVMSVGSVTQALCQLQVGDAIGLRGPFGSAWPSEQLRDRNIIIMAGGLGLAPLRPLLFHLLGHRNCYRELQLLYGTRQPQSIVFADEISLWQASKLIDVAVTVDNAERDWPGEVGVVTDLLKGLTIDAENTSAVICGPEVMMRFSAYALLDCGVAANNIFVSMERNMKCAVKMCGRCQFGPFFICHDGPVFSFDNVARLFKIREL